MWERRPRHRARFGLATVLAALATSAPVTVAQWSPQVTADVAPRTAAPTADVSAVAGPDHQSSRPAISSAGEQVIAPAPATFDAPAAPPAAPPSVLHAAAATPGDGVWAVVIGIDDYPGHRSDLRQSVRDADMVDWTLSRYGVPSAQRLVLRDTQASSAVIADAMRWLVARAGPNATAVVFYAGHVRKLDSGREAIVAADGGLVTDAALADLLRPLAARNTWLVLAACYAGGFTELMAPGRILTGASSADALAYENEQYGNSYLVEYMVERAMVQGLAPMSIEAAFRWAYDALRAEHPARVPVQYDEVPGDLRLGEPPSPAAPRRPATPPPEPAPSPSPPPSTPPEEEDEEEDGRRCLPLLGALVGCADRATYD